jgi:hypothetical protein
LLAGPRSTLLAMDQARIDFFLTVTIGRPDEFVPVAAFS